MVEISIYAEGPSPEHNAQTNAARTMSNSVRLRREFNRILSEVADRDDINISLTFTVGYKATLKRFAEHPNINYAFSDSECVFDHNNRNAWFKEMLESNDDESKNIVIAQERKDDVFFMIQAMEAWFLKQPKAIERWADYKGYFHKEGVSLIKKSVE